MINIHRLLDECIDHDQIVYESVFSALLKGITVSKLDKARFSSGFKKEYEFYKTPQVVKAIFLSTELGLDFMVTKNHSIRGAMAPFYNRVFHKDDLVEIKFYPKEDKVHIRLFEKSSERTWGEVQDSIFNTDKYIEKQTHSFLFNIKNYSNGSVSKQEAEFLSYLGIISMKDFQFKKPTSTSKGKIVKPSFEQDLINYVNNFTRLPKKYKSVKGMMILSQVRTYQFDLNSSELSFERWQRKNIQFWNKEEIPLPELKNLTFNSGRLIEN